MKNLTGLSGVFASFDNGSSRNTTGNGRIPLEYSLDYRIVATCLHVIIFLVGFFGNIAVVIVVKKAKSMHTPTYCYLVSLAVADLLVLVSAMPEAIMSHHLYANQWVLGHAGCSLLVFMNFLGVNASSTSILCFTVERYIAICHPLIAQKVCTVKRALRIISGVWILAVIYCSPWLGLTTIKTVHFDAGFPSQERCSFLLEREHYVYFFMTDIVLFYVLPLFVSIVLYARIGIVIHRSMDFKLGRSSSTRQAGNLSRNNSANYGNWRDTQLLRKSSRYDKPAEKDQTLVQVIRMLLVVVICFALLWLPYRGLLVYNSFHKPWLNKWYLLSAKTLIYINSAINPVLYNAMSKRFRTVFLRIILCIDRTDHQGTQASSHYYEYNPSIAGSAAVSRRSLSVRAHSLGRKDSSASGRGSVISKANRRTEMLHSESLAPTASLPRTLLSPAHHSTVRPKPSIIPSVDVEGANV